MSALYATITSKGQITLPVEARRALGLRSGQKVAVRVEGDHLIIDRPQDVTTLRDKLRTEAKQRGTWGSPPHAGDGWSARTEDHRGER